MDAPLQSLLDRLEQVSDQFRELRDGVRQVIKIADASPEMALTRARKVLEYVIRDVYERRINEPPGTRPLESLLQRLVKDGFFPDRLDAYANTIRKLGNVGTHSFGETVEIADVYQSLAQLMPILQWYFEVERPEALGGQIEVPATVAMAHAAPVVRPPEPRMVPSPAAPAGRIFVVPKGLRSFDSHDADFFVDLLPGPRDKDGLPEGIRFWKHRIESDNETAFTVGVMYGPSGCGKSSLVKAGLLPRLAGRIVSVFLEATSGDTETRLHKGLLKQFPDLPGELDLPRAVAALRQETGRLAGHKVLIVIDQFEQWLQDHRNQQDTELAAALRQCDGDHVQCILLVRDDFWTALSRFMGELQIEMLQGQNAVLVDLFDPIHARNVLAAFGRAFGRLEADITKEQAAFLDQAIEGLAEDGRVISVRLALFAEMVKGKPWTPATLDEVGGIAGIGVSFLEETFYSRSASPQHRKHAEAARGVLKALLPEVDSDIKGRMQSHDALLQASGYQDRPQEFGDLLRILDTELRLVTPTDPDTLQAGSASNTDSNYFQLTHDYLVPSLRQWLTRKQKETRRGRAELTLADRAAMWTARPENRQLPSFAQWLGIRTWTQKKHWTPPERKMMRKAGRVHGSHVVIATALLVALSVVAGQAYGRIHADSLVGRLQSANISEVPGLVRQIAPFRRWADPLLRKADTEAAAGSADQLRIKLGLLPIDASQTEYVYHRLLDAPPDEVTVLLKSLDPYKSAILEPLWSVAETRANDKSRARLRAATALAAFAPDDPRWATIQDGVANDFVASPAVYLETFLEALRPVREKLLSPLSAIFRDANRPETERALATEILAEYAADHPLVLAELLFDADEQQFLVIFPKLQRAGDIAESLVLLELQKPSPADASEAEKEKQGKRRANSGVAIFKLGQPDKVWPLLKARPDPRARSYLVDRFGPLGCDAGTIVKRLDEEPDVSARRALILSLGEFSEQQWPESDRVAAMPKLQTIYRTADDPGLRAAAGWLLRQAGQVQGIKKGDEQLSKDMAARQQRLSAIKSAIATPKSDATPRWYMNCRAQTMVVLPGPIEFMMGSPLDEEGRNDDEVQHKQRIGRTFAIAASSVTVGEFRDFDASYKLKARQASSDDCPAVNVSWYQAALYCNWLSKQEGIAPEQWCYEAEPSNDAQNSAGQGRVARMKNKFLSLAGYRLPTEAELEYATRAGTTTSRYYGETEPLLPKYAWYSKNSAMHTWPVARLKPNEFGLFDTLGNAYGWCQDAYEQYSVGKAGEATEDTEGNLTVEPKASRVLRGGAFDDEASYIRSAYRHINEPTWRSSYLGFRMARTIAAE